jgi:hypothetical protein
MNLKEIGWGPWTRYVWLNTGTSDGFSARRNVFSGLVKPGELLT